MKHLLTIVLVAAALALPRGAIAQDRFPALTLEQLTPAQKAYVDSISKPPRNADFRRPPYRVYIRSPKLAERTPGIVLKRSSRR